MKQAAHFFLFLFLFAANAKAQCPMGVIASASSNPVCKGDSSQITTVLIGGCSSYTVTNIANATISGTPINVTLGNDQVSTALPIGFTFNFFCINYTQFYISSNGFITFSPSSPDGCCSGQAIPNAAAPNNLIALAWEDYDPSAGGTINYFTTGTAPNRQLVVNFINVPHFGGGGGALTGQIVLYETTNEIDVQITSQTSDGGLHTQGVEDASGTIGFASPGRNAVSWSTSNNGKRFSPGPSPSGSFTYSWSPSTGLSNTTIGNPVASPLQTTTYVVTVSDTACPPISDTLIIFVDTSITTVSILNPDTFICAGGNVQMVIADTGAATYFWSPATALSCITCPNPVASPSFTTTYYVTAYTPMGICSDADSITISVGNLNQILISASATSMCSAGDTVQLDASAGNSNCSTYTILNVPFAPVAGNGTSVVLGDDQLSSSLPIGFNFTFYCNNYSNFMISSNGFITFEAAATNNGCCTGQLLPNPATPNDLVSFAWNDLDPSSGGNIDYFTTGSAPNRKLVMNFTNVPHFSGGGPVTAQVLLYESTNTIEIHTTSMLTDGTAHTMGLENSAGSMAHPVAGRNADATWSASNEGIRFMPGSTVGNLTYTWAPVSGLSNPNIANPVSTPTGTITYTVTVTDTLAGCSLSGVITVTVSPVPTAVVSPASATICAGQFTTLTASGGTAYSWAPGGQTTSAIAVAPFSTTSYTVTVTNASGCTDDAVVTVTVNALPFITIAGNTTICNGQSATLTATGGATYSWIPSGQTINPIVVTPTANTTYSVIGTNASGCTNAASVTVNVIQPAVASFTFSVAGSTVTFTSTSQNATSWNWNFGDAGTSTLQNPVHVYASNGTYTVTLIVSNACGSDTATSVIIIATGVEEYANNYLLSVFPNPASDKITISIEALNPSASTGTIMVLNAIGKEIFYIDIQRILSFWEQPITFAAASSGIYLIKVTLDDAVLTRRVVINK